MHLSIIPAFMGLSIVHITTSDYGGEGLAAYRLHLSLLERQINSKMLVVEKKHNTDTIIPIGHATKPWFVPSQYKCFRIIQTILRYIGIGRSPIEKYTLIYRKVKQNHDVFFTFPISDYEVHKHPLVDEADIIHLHWIENFVDYPSFFNSVEKPIIWTIHDLNAIYGGFHHAKLRELYLPYYSKLEKYFCKVKKNSIVGKDNITMVAISNEMYSFLSNHDCYQGKKIELINNSVSPSDFIRYNEKTIRGELGITESIVFLFVCWNLNDSMKGLDIAISALSKLEIRDSILLCVGNGEIPCSVPKTKRIAPASDSRQLSKYYSCADFLLFPSLQEGFAQTPLEAMACGTPVVMTPVSGAKEQIRNFNGVISKDFSTESFAAAIETAMSRRYDSNQIRHDAINRFSHKSIAEKYINIYIQISTNHL